MLSICCDIGCDSTVTHDSVKVKIQNFLMFHTAHTKRESTMVKNFHHLIIYELTVPKNPGLYSILGDFQNKFIHLTSVQLAASTYYWISRKFNALSTLLLLLFRENFSVWKCEASHESATLTLKMCFEKKILNSKQKNDHKTT